MQLQSLFSIFNRRLLLVPPILIGAAILFVAVASRDAPRQEDLPETSRPLLVIEVPKITVVPRVLGFGTARPSEIWSAVAEVKGRIVETHSELNPGAIIQKGQIVLRIDPADYELQIAQIQAEVAQVEAQRVELETQGVNYIDALAIEAKSLKLARGELARLGRLRASNAVTASEYEDMSRNVLLQEQKSQSLQSSLKVLPSKKKALEASVEAKRAALAQAQLDLGRTEIRAPFDCRLSDVSLEVGQFVNAGQSLFEAYGSAVTEIEAQMPIDQVRKLLTHVTVPLDLKVDAMKTIRLVFDVEVVVRLRTGEFAVQWKGRFDRIREELDLQTRTLRVVVAVDRPYENVVPGQRPPLAPGMFCEVELRGKPRADRVVVPRTSVWNDAVYLVSSENRLQRQPVTVAFSQGGFSVIAEGLSGGERLVVSDPTPAIVGMLVEPSLSEPIRAGLVTEAAGTGELR